MTGLRATWILVGRRGWADVVLADEEAETAVEASYSTSAPEDLLTAIGRVVTWPTQTRVEFERALARSRIRSFDENDRTLGEAGYHRVWGRPFPFPCSGFEALRSLWREHRNPLPDPASGLTLGL